MTEISNPPPSLPSILPNSLDSNIISSSEPIRHISSIAPKEPERETQQEEIIKVSTNNDDNNSESNSATTTTDNASSESQGTQDAPKLPFSSFSAVPSLANSFLSQNKTKMTPELLRTQSCPEIKYDDCREFDSFAGKWVDSKGQDVLISPWGVIRYPNNPKLRFEATFLGPNHLSVTFDKDPKRRKFVGKLSHECDLLIWSNDTKWAKKGSKNDPKFHDIKKKRKNSKTRSNSCLVQ